MLLHGGKILLKNYFKTRKDSIARKLSKASGTKNAKGEYVSSFFHLPNPDLEPQKTRSPEVNLTYKFTPDFTVILAGYYSWIDNMINDTFYGTSSNFGDRFC